MFNAFLRASLLTHHQVYAFFSSFSKSALSSSFPHECAVAAQGTPIAGFASGVGAQGGTFMIPHRGMEKDLMVWWFAGSEERRTNCGFVLSFVGGFCE